MIYVAHNPVKRTTKIDSLNYEIMFQLQYVYHDCLNAACTQRSEWTGWSQASCLQLFAPLAYYARGSYRTDWLHASCLRPWQSAQRPARFVSAASCARFPRAASDKDAKSITKRKLFVAQRLPYFGREH